MLRPNVHQLTPIFQWEVRTWSRAYPLWHAGLKKRSSEGATALALGERDGGLSTMLAEHGFRTVCSDLHGPTEQARELHRSRAIADRVTYAEIDCLAIPFPDHSFDVVAFKSMIGALGTKDRQLAALREMHRVLKPGGALYFAENLHGTRLHRWLRARFVPWDSYWRYLDPVGDLDLFDTFQRVDLHSTGLFANLGRSESQRDLIARFDRILLPLLPKRWRTVWFGEAIKG